jgi:hypothetical protein
MKGTKILIITSAFPAVPEEIWPLLTQIKTLRYIAFPYAIFTSADGMERTEWREGETRRFRLRVFGLIPLGTHTIHIAEMNCDTYTIRSRESNRFVPIWNHTITLKQFGENVAEYADVIELGAGKLTGIVCVWARAFYHHRQRKWIKLLARMVMNR